VVRVFTGGPADEHPVGITVVRPKLREPALGPARAGRTGEASIALTGTLEPEAARLDAEPSPGTRVRRVEARDGRFRVELALRPGRNEVLLRARAPGRAPTELAPAIVTPDRTVGTPVGPKADGSLGFPHGPQRATTPEPSSAAVSSRGGARGGRGVRGVRRRRLPWEAPGSRAGPETGRSPPSARGSCAPTRPGR
jgi:hypothetical protein